LKTDFVNLSAQIQMLWTLACAALVMFMQAGFTCLESGSVREKNSVNVAVKNVTDLCVSFPAFFLLGYAIMFGSDLGGLFGAPNLFLSNLEGEELTGFFFQAAFCSTTATIVSGGVAERCRFLAYVLVTAAVGLFIYPIFGHWAWGKGFLHALGYHDFAGSSVVHMVGAGVALAGIQILGPREGRFDRMGRPVPMPGSSMPTVALGVMILLFGWIGFNGGSAPLSSQTPVIIVNTVLAGCCGGLGAMLLGWALRGLAPVDLILNGILGGLVAITACADVVRLTPAAAIGVLGGMAVVLGCHLLERLELDDPVGAVPVHGCAGIVGVLSAGLFAHADALAALRMERWHLIQAQIVGVIVCVAWSYGASYFVWKAVGRLVPLRVGALEESVGMNFSAHEIAAGSAQRSGT
jgi:Amt family ammonium transporter